MKVSFFTLGCKVNQYETDAMADSFRHRGFEVVGEGGFADVYIINTCTVTSMSDKKSRQIIRKARRLNPGAIVAAVGCYAQVSADEVAKIEGVNLVIGNTDKSVIVDKILQTLPESAKIQVKNIFEVENYEEMKLYHTEGNTRAYLKIQDGCNQFCSYCIIPFARGRVRSRQLADVVDEAVRLSKSGYKEIVLTGINISSYGSDGLECDLSDLILALDEIEGIKRIRLGSIEQSLITERFLHVMRSSKKLCNQFHLSLQSGSSTVLKRMNRKYQAAEYLGKVKMIRSVDPAASITTDIIVGFPGETDAEFEETCSFVKDVSFAQVHLFKYSQRKGTLAYKMEDQVDEKIKNDRMRILEELTLKSTESYRKSFIGEEMKVLFETKNRKGLYEGYTENYVPVVVKSAFPLTNLILNVKLESLEEGHLKGELKEV